MGTSSSVEVRHGAFATFVKDVTGGEAVQAVGGIELVRLAGGDGVGETPTRGGRRLEAAVAPSGVEIEPLNRRAVDDRRAVHRHIHDAAPLAQVAQAAE